MHAAPFSDILLFWSLTLTSTSLSSSLCVNPTTNTPLIIWHLGRWRSAILICCVRKFVRIFSLTCISIFSAEFLNMCSTYLFHYMCRVHNESPIRVLNADMFATPWTSFDLPSYADELANLLAEALSPPPIRIQPFNKLVEDYLHIEAEEDEDSDRHGGRS